MKRFPKDCDKNCEYFSCYDLSVDDLVAVCSLLMGRCDLCEQDYCYVICPLEEK